MWNKFENTSFLKNCGQDFLDFLHECYLTVLSNHIVDSWYSAKISHFQIFTLIPRSWSMAGNNQYRINMLIDWCHLQKNTLCEHWLTSFPSMMQLINVSLEIIVLSNDHQWMKNSLKNRASSLNSYFIVNSSVHKWKKKWNENNDHYIIDSTN